MHLIGVIDLTMAEMSSVTHIFLLVEGGDEPSTTTARLVPDGTHTVFRTCVDTPPEARLPFRGRSLAMGETGDSGVHVRRLTRHPRLLPLVHWPTSSCRHWRGPSHVGILLAVALAALASSRCCQAEEGASLTPPQLGGVGAAEPQRWYWDPLRDFAVDVASDTGHVLTAPTRWDSHDWLLAGLAGGTIVGAAVFLDEPIQRFNNEHPSRFADHLEKRAEPFGAIYSFAVLGAFEVAGLALEDERGTAVFRDGLEATVIASGLITPTLKFVVGRSRPNADHGPHHFQPFSSSASFPSGHATQAFAVASVVATSYDEVPWVAPIAYTGAGLVGFARIRGNNHFLSDVIAGAVIGTGVGYTVVQANRGRQHPQALTIAPLVCDAGQGVSIEWRF